MLARRLKQARLASGLSLAELAKRLSARDIPITRAALSNYELGKRKPAASIVRALGKELGVASGYFLGAEPLTINWLAFRCQNRPGKLWSERIKAQAEQIAEKACRLFDIVPTADRLDFPHRRSVQTDADAEQAASALRQAWGLGCAPILSLCQTAEMQGAIVVSMDDGACSDCFACFAGMIHGRRPLLVLNGQAPSEQRRFNLAHTIGHVIMDSDGLPEETAEGLAQRFAASLLVPPAVVKRELGERRQSLSLHELVMLKRRYGMSMAAWLYVARAHKVITEQSYTTLWAEFGRRGWKHCEPIGCGNQEEPMRLRQLTARALAEGLIDRDEARALCPEDELAGLAPEALPASKLRNAVRDERQQRLLTVAEAAATEYETNHDLTDCEAYEKDEFSDGYG
ncbi:MAG: helix-turn-helix domain-containing protein [Lentisphaeria bacterium]